MTIRPYRPRRLSRRSYEKAEQFLPWNIATAVRNADVKPRWLPNGTEFCYRRQTARGHEWVVVNVADGKRRPAFDHAALARWARRRLGLAMPARALSLEFFAFEESGPRVRFGLQGRQFSGDGDLRKIVELPQVAARTGESVSPDGRRALLLRDGNLWLRELPDGATRPVTLDAEDHFGYAKSPDSNCVTIATRLTGTAVAPVAVWAPDSRRVVTHRLDERRVREVPLVQHVASDGRPIAALHLYRNPYPGDEHVPLAHVCIIDVESGRKVDVAAPPYLASMTSPLEQGFVWWSRDGQQLFAIRRERAEKELHFEVIDATSGIVRRVVSERGDTYVEASSVFWGRAVAVVESSRELVWFSERSGWGQLYLYDLNTGALKHALTTGEWVVTQVNRVDEHGRWVYFMACGREPGRDPYFRHLYRVSLDGGSPELLTPEDAEHSVLVPRNPLAVSIASAIPDPSDPGFSPDGRHFIDTFSTADTAPRSVLRAADGRLVAVLEDCDYSALARRRWRWPERVRAKGRDGVTDIHGLLWRPTDFDPDRSYPVVDCHYPGPHTTKVPRASLQADAISMWWYAEGRYWAELGFIAVMLDGQGGPFRSKRIHDVSYGNISDCGTPDRIAAIRELAAARPYMDLDRVGIVGHSGGGFGAARALFDHSDFYKVGVASAGSHDLRTYGNAFPEQFMGPFDEGAYAANASAASAAGLRGKLLLCVGDLDENTHPALTLGLVRALIDANKDFDLLIYPGGDHTVIGRGYYLRRHWDYLVRHLLGAEPPQEYELWDPRSGKPPKARGR